MAFRQLDEPNVVLPLATSYNTRGIDAFTNVFTTGLDQRKVNSMYEPIVNSTTGKGTFKLIKRPGVKISSETFGTSGQVAYLIHVLTDLNAWLFSTSANAVRASNSTGTTTTIVTEASRVPIYVDSTFISAVETVVLQTAIAAATQKVYYASAIGSWTEITDSVFTGLTHQGKMEHGWGFAFILDARGRIYNSSINTLATWPASNFITKQIALDAQRGLMKYKNMLLAFGYESCEVYGNQGNATGSPLVSIPNMQSKIGIATPATGATHYYTIVGDKLYFVGNQGSIGSTEDGLYVFDGGAFIKVSPPHIDKIISSALAVYSVNKCSINGQEAVALSLDLTSATTQRWLVYFPKWNEWFEWNSTVFTPVNDLQVYLGVGSNQHRVYFLNNSDTWQDNGTNYTFTHQFKWPKDGSHFASMPMFGVKGDTARSAQLLSVQFSDDDGQTWSAARDIDMTVPKKNIYRCGGFLDRQVRLSYAGALDLRLESALARVT